MSQGFCFILKKKKECPCGRFCRKRAVHYRSLGPSHARNTATRPTLLYQLVLGKVNPTTVTTVTSLGRRKKKKKSRRQLADWLTVQRKELERLHSTFGDVSQRMQLFVVCFSKSVSHRNNGAENPRLPHTFPRPANVCGLWKRRGGGCTNYCTRRRTFAL